jgi:hypothetical protein
VWVIVSPHLTANRQTIWVLKVNPKPKRGAEMVEKDFETVISSQAVNELQTRLPGKVILPEHSDYHEARKLWNGFIDRYPAVIVRCRDANDVAESIRFARARNLEIAVRGGGHSVPGYSTVDGGLMIDLSQMKEVIVDPQRQIALVSAGVKLGELIRATEHYGLVTPVGTDSDTGVAGLTLGGGFGFLTGKYGLTCDNVLSYTMVTAEGDVVQANAEENPDLYWGLRGGGGNFGVVTTFEFKLHSQNGVLGGMLIHPMDRAGDVLRFYRDYCDQSPDEVTVFAAMITTPQGFPAVAFTPCYCGDLKEGERVLQPLRRFGSPLVDQIQPMSYFEMVSMLTPGFPAGVNYYDKGRLFTEFSEGAIEQTVAAANSRTSPLSYIIIQHSHGAFSRVPAQATAFAARGSTYGPIISASWKEGPAEPHIEWVRNSFAAYKPFAIEEMYVNFIDTEELGQVPSAYGINYARLVELKRRYDPENVFHRNANIRP